MVAVISRSLKLKKTKTVVEYNSKSSKKGDGYKEENVFKSRHKTYRYIKTFLDDLPSYKVS